VDVLSDAIAVPDLVSVAVEQPAAVATKSRSGLESTYSNGLESWFGRACICWLCAALPLLVSELPLLAAMRLALPVAGIWFFVAVAVEQSSPERRPAFGPAARVLWRLAIGLVAVAAMAEVAPGVAPPLGDLLAASVVFIVAGIAWELLVDRAESHAERVLFVCGSQQSLELGAALGSRGSRCRPIGFVCEENVQIEAGGMRALGSIDDLVDVIHNEHPRIVAVGQMVARERVFAALAEAGDEELNIVNLEELHEYLLGRLPVRDIDNTWLMSALHFYRRPYGRLTKRAFDVVVAVAGLVLAAPLMALVAVALKRTGGSALYRQTRQGQRNAPFTILKFRTMREDAELDGRPVWATADDPRVTKLGRVLRRTRLDELPQLWNVLTGSMSVVGPRPERPEYFETLSENLPLWSLRTLLKPGITGWAQINDGYAADLAGAETKLSYDLWYLRHRSLLVDAAICARTLSRVWAGSR
jgi:exopolysaccharide biosynthesis polyprenyl glycosylphosphotransferase